MSDLISRQAVIALAKDICVPTKDGTVYKHRCIDPDAIKELPSAEKTGEWIWDDEGFHCSECWYHAYENIAEILNENWYYCPHCGARMEVQDEID